MRYVVGNTVSFGEGRSHIEKTELVTRFFKSHIVLILHGAVLFQLSELNEASKQ